MLAESGIHGRPAILDRSMLGLERIPRRNKAKARPHGEDHEQDDGGDELLHGNSIVTPSGQLAAKHRSLTVAAPLGTLDLVCAFELTHVPETEPRP
jgi:hypothetical protein